MNGATNESRKAREPLSHEIPVRSSPLQIRMRNPNKPRSESETSTPCPEDGKVEGVELVERKYQNSKGVEEGNTRIAKVSG